MLHVSRLHNPRCPFSPVRIEAAASDLRLDVASFLIGYGLATLDGDVDGYMRPQEALSHSGAAVALLASALEPARERIKRRLLVRDAKPPAPAAKRDRNRQHCLKILGYFGALCCESAVDYWQELRADPQDGDSIGWEVEPDEIMAYSIGSSISMSPRRVARASIIQALHSATDMTLEQAIACILPREKYPMLWEEPRNDGEWSARAFGGDRKDICRAYPSDHEDQRFSSGEE